MKFFRMLRRSIRDAFKSVFRNFSLSLASISCITITLIIVAISIIVTFNVQNFTKEMEKDLTIVVFLDTDTTEEEVNDIKDKLESMSNVESLTYQSKSAVKEEMSKENEIFNEVMSTWDDENNPLKDTFQSRPRRPFARAKLRSHRSRRPSDARLCRQAGSEPSRQARRARNP